MMVSGDLCQSIDPGNRNRRIGGGVDMVAGPADNHFSMRFEVRLFALYRERAGASLVSVDLPEGSSVGELTDAVRADYPMLAPPEVRIVVAVNAEYADDDLTLQAGDEVCLIPPVSGG